MKDHDKTIIDFLSEPENFRTMLKVVDRYRLVREHLLTEFWKLVEKKIQVLLANEKNKWITYIQEFMGRDEMIFLYKQNWLSDPDEEVNIVAVGYWPLTIRRVGYGLWINEYDKSWDLERMKGFAINKILPRLKGFESVKWGPVFTRIEYDFSESRELEKILIDKRQDLADEFAKTLVGFALDVEADLDEMIKMKKANKPKTKKGK